MKENRVQIEDFINYNNISSMFRRTLREIQLSEIPEAALLDHTMTFSLNQYVEQKLPVNLLDIIAAQQIEIVVLSSHTLDSCSELKISVKSLLNFSYISHNKTINFIRAKWYAGIKNDNKNIILVHILAGADYARHIGSLILHALWSRTQKYKDLLRIFYNPISEYQIAEWTALSKYDIPAQSTIILGLVDIAISIEALECEKYYENDYLIIWKAKSNIHIIGWKFSFWGRLSARIIRYLCKFRPKEIIYIGKLGTLVSPEDVYNKIYSPNIFFAFNRLREIRASFQLQNPLKNSGLVSINAVRHVSVPTIIEECFEQKKLLSKNHIETIDNEISFMAAEIFRHNNIGGSTYFTCIHYATDFIRDRSNWSLLHPHDLSTNRSMSAIFLKENMHARIKNILSQYLL